LPPKFARYLSDKNVQKGAGLMMYILLIILLLLTLIVLILLFTVITIRLEFNTNANELAVRLSWLNSLLTAKANVRSSNSSIDVYLGKIRIFSKVIKALGGKKILKWKLIRALDLNNSFANVYYSFDNPFSTGITSGVIQIIQSYLSGIKISQFPDFLSFDQYVYIIAGSELDLGRTLANIMRVQLENKNKRRDIAWSR
jgi:hypothetical protein